MDRKIAWSSGRFDEIELVYEKAEGNAGIGALLEELETLALSEAHDHCGLLRTEKGPITAEQFEAMSASDRETVIYLLSGIGLADIALDYKAAKITLKLSPMIQNVMGCTVFSILNRLEKLDGSFSVRCPKATLEIQVPLGGKKGLMKWEMLIMQLYPWLSVREVSAHEVAQAVNTSTKSDETQMPKKKKGFFWQTVWKVVAMSKDVERF